LGAPGVHFGGWRGGRLRLYFAATFFAPDPGEPS